MLPDVVQNLASDPRLMDFFTQDRVIIAAGGHAFLRSWVKRGENVNGILKIIFMYQIWIF